MNASRFSTLPLHHLVSLARRRRAKHALSGRVGNPGCDLRSIEALNINLSVTTRPIRGPSTARRLGKLPNEAKLGIRQ